MDQNKKTLRSFQCRDYLWEIFGQMSAELECSVDYLINEAMRQYARSRNYGVRSPSTPGMPSPRTGPPPGQPMPQPMPQAMPPGPPPAAPIPSVKPASRPPIPSAPPPRPGPTPGAYGAAAAPFPSAPQAPPPQAAPPGYGGYPSAPGYPPQAAPPAYPPQAAPPAYPPQPAPGYPPQAAPPGYPSAPPAYPPQAGYPSAPAPRPGAPAPRPSAPPPLPGSSAPGPMPGARPTLFAIFNGQKIPVTKDEFVIGRGSKTADLPIKDGNISRRHAAVVFQGGAFYIKDLGSTNGIEHLGRRIDSKRIEEGDVFAVCDYEIRFTYR
jgi:hypothetical protein